MVYLEAQRMGLPVAAFNSMGVPLSVIHGKTGLLAPEADINQYSENLSLLLSHPDLRRDLGQAAAMHILQDHSLTAAARSLDQALHRVLSGASRR